MLRGGRMLAWTLFACFSAVACAQQPKEIVQEAVHVELAADASDHTRWLYYEIDKKPRDGTVQWVAQTPFGDLARILKKDGHALSIAEQRSRMESFIRDTSAQSKQRKGGQHDEQEATQMLNMLPNAFTWSVIGNRNGTMTLHFKPDLDFVPPTWESRVFAAMEGDMEVDDEQHRIVSLEGTMIKEVKFGWGLFGSIEPGGGFQVVRRQVEKNLWQITEIHVHIQGHALIFKSISEQQDDVKSRFEELPTNISFQEAEEKLLAHGQ